MSADTLTPVEVESNGQVLVNDLGRARVTLAQAPTLRSMPSTSTSARDGGPFSATSRRRSPGAATRPPTGTPGLTRKSATCGSPTTRRPLPVRPRRTTCECSWRRPRSSAPSALQCARPTNWREWARDAPIPDEAARKPYEKGRRSRAKLVAQRNARYKTTKYPRAETLFAAPGREGHRVHSRPKLAIRTRAGNGDPDQARCEATGIWLGRHGGEIQHIRARGMGGSQLRNVISNGVLLSREAHRRAEARVPHMRAMGFWLLSGDPPSPIMLHGEQGGVTVWLSDDGRYLTESPQEAA